MPTARLSWTVSGTNANAYSTPDIVTVTVVDSPEGTPELSLIIPEDTGAG